MSVKGGVRGFGRIGRNYLRVPLAPDNQFEVVAGQGLQRRIRLRSTAAIWAQGRMFDRIRPEWK